MCDTLVAVGPHTADGITVFAKNSDRKGDECQPFVRVEAATHASGAALRCTHVSIAQTSQTFAVMGHSPWWIWGFEHGVNEHGLAIGNETVFSREPVEAEAGLIGMDLVRLGLERGATARAALDVMTELLEAHGQGGAAMAPDGGAYSNGFLLADPAEAWILETSNRRWAARRTDLASVSNRLSLGADWDLSSPDLTSFATEHGWWDDRGRIDVTAAYRSRDVPGWLADGRLRRSGELLTAYADAVDVTSMQRILRDHGRGGQTLVPGAAPDEEAFYTLCMHSEPVSTTTASIVTPLPADRRRPWPVWISFATPCTSTFLPVYLDVALPAALADASPDGAWWTFERLRAAAAADFPAWTPLVREAWAPLEAEIENARVAAEGADDRRRLAAFVEEAASRSLALAAELTERITTASG